MKARTNCIVVVSDTHCGCQMALMSPEGLTHKGGQHVSPSPFQRWLWQRWDEFWHKFVPLATEGDDFDMVVNGDIIDNRHHGATSHVTENLAEQFKIAAACFAPVLELPKLKRVFVIGGTDAHAGIDAEHEETLAQQFRATPDELGNFCRNDLWLHLGMAGRHPALVHILHHIGTSGSAAYETTALQREYVEACQEAARWRLAPPDVIVRSHRHRAAETRVQSGNGYATVVVTAGWQGKTPYTFRIQGARQAIPQFGGVVVRSGEIDTYTRSACYGFKRSRPE